MDWSFMNMYTEFCDSQMPPIAQSENNRQLVYRELYIKTCSYLEFYSIKFYISFTHIKFMENLDSLESFIWKLFWKVIQHEGKDFVFL